MAQRARDPGASQRPVLTGADIGRIIDRIGHQILEKTGGDDNTILLGIPTRGVPLARRLTERIKAFEGLDLPHGSLDVTLYRDDLRMRSTRALGPTQIPAVGVDDRRVILVDDVLYSGRTIRAALNGLYDLGRPEWVQLAVLVDRGHRRLPVRADYVGKNLPTAMHDSVSVLVSELDGADAVYVDKEEQR